MFGMMIDTGPRSRSQTLNFCVKVVCLMFTMSVFVKPLMDLIPVWQCDRNWSKILCGTSPTQYMTLRSRSQTSNFYIKVLCYFFTISVFCKPSVDLNHVWHDDQTLSKILRRAIPSPSQYSDLKVSCLRL